MKCLYVFGETVPNSEGRSLVSQKLAAEREIDEATASKSIPCFSSWIDLSYWVCWQTRSSPSSSPSPQFQAVLWKPLRTVGYSGCCYPCCSRDRWCRPCSSWNCFSPTAGLMNGSIHRLVSAAQCLGYVDRLKFDSACLVAIWLSYQIDYPFNYYDLEDAERWACSLLPLQWFLFVVNCGTVGKIWPVISINDRRIVIIYWFYRKVNHILVIFRLKLGSSYGQFRDMVCRNPNSDHLHILILIERTTDTLFC